MKEPLSSAIMLQLGFVPTAKEDGLREFQRRGWVLVDATYEPVNADGVDRDAVILRDYPLLGGRSTSIVNPDDYPERDATSLRVRCRR